MLSQMYAKSVEEQIGRIIKKKIFFTLQQALDPINRPTFWPHDAEEQVEPKDDKAAAH